MKFHPNAMARPEDSISNAGMASPPRQFRKTFIREYREDRGLTLEDLGAKIGKTASQLSMLERGQRGYTQETLEAIAEVLKTTTANLLSRRPEDAKEDSLVSMIRDANDNERRMIERIIKSVVNKD